MIAAASIVRDYVVSTTYRKEEQAGLKWSRLRGERDPAGEPEVALRLDENGHEAQRPARQSLTENRCLAAVPSPSATQPGPMENSRDGMPPRIHLPPDAILGTVLEHAALPLRWEPLNDGTQHRGIPSGGGAFGAELFLIARDHQGLARFRHLPQEGALIHEGSSRDLQEILAGADLAFVIVGNLASYLDPYGEFSPCLASLECGFLEAQLSLLFRAYGWESETVTRHDYRLVSEGLQLGHWSRIPEIVMRVTGPGASEAVERCRRETLAAAAAVPSAHRADDYPRMRELIETIVDEPVPACQAASAIPQGASPAGIAAGPPTALLELIRHRSSGRSADMARQDGRTSMAVLAALAAEIAELHSLEGPSDLSAASLSLTLLATDAGGQAVPFDVDLRNGRLSPAAEASKAWTQCMFTIAVDDIAEERQSGSRSFLLSHIAAGALGQKVCLAATAHGLFARPLRGYAEPEANRFLGLECRAILRIACGVKRQANPAYDLRWW